MALKGLGQRPIPYVPECERDSEQPTIFWIKPKNTRQTYASLNRYSDATENLRSGGKKVNAVKMFEGDKADFMSFCARVDNYQFSDEFPELAKKGVVAKIEDVETLEKVIEDLDPQIFQEIQDAASNWTLLKNGEKKDLKF